MGSYFASSANKKNADYKNQEDRNSYQYSQNQDIGFMIGGCGIRIRDLEILVFFVFRGSAVLEVLQSAGWYDVQ